MKKNVKNIGKEYEIREYRPGLIMKPIGNDVFAPKIFMYSFIASLQSSQRVSRHELSFLPRYCE
jgi:hypothetical protein